MSRRLLLLVALFTALAVGFAAVQNEGGPPRSRTGAPGEQNCSNSCHLSTVNAGSGSLEISVGGRADYVPGQTYEIVVSVMETGTSKFGYQLTALDAEGAQAGSFAAPDNQSIIVTGNVGGGLREYAQHTRSGTPAANPGEKSWTLEWTAPETGTGEVAFFAAAVAANGNGRNSGDQVYTASLTIDEAQSSGNELTITSLPEQDTLCLNQAGGNNRYSAMIEVSGDFGDENVVRLELSDAQGGFDDALQLGVTTGPRDTEIEFLLPPSVEPGAGYFLRLAATDPETFGAAEGPFTIFDPEPEIQQDGERLFVDDFGFEYQWYFEGAQIADANGPEIQADASGEYCLEINAPGIVCFGRGCINYVATSRKTLEDAGALRLSPNPAGEFVRISRPAEAVGDAQLRLFDLNGRRVRATKIPAGAAQYELSLAGLPAGVYTLEAVSKSSVSRAKLVVE